MDTAATKIQSLYRCHRHRWKYRMIKEQKKLSEHVEDLATCQARLRVTCAERIDSVSAQFTPQGEKARVLREKLISASQEAHLSLETIGSATPRQYDKLIVVAGTALVEELIISLQNDLMLTKPSECVFGISTCADTMTIALDSATVPDEMLGLLVYRAWQLLVRKRPGREVLIACSGLVMRDDSYVPYAQIDWDQNCDRLQPDSYNSIATVLLHEFKTKSMPQYLSRCVSKLPTCDNANHGLTCVEKGKILSSIDELEWHEWYF